MFVLAVFVTEPAFVSFKSAYALTDCCVGISVALLDAMLSSSTNAVAVIVPSLSEPNCTVPLVVMPVAPVIEPPNTNAPLCIVAVPSVNLVPVICPAAKLPEASLATTLPDVLVVVASTATASAVTVIYAPSPTLNTLSAASVPPPIKPSPAVNVVVVNGIALNDTAPAPFVIKPKFAVPSATGNVYPDPEPNVKDVVIVALAANEFSTGATLEPKFCVPAPNVTSPLISKLVPYMFVNLVVALPKSFPIATPLEPVNTAAA